MNIGQVQYVQAQPGPVLLQQVPVASQGARIVSVPVAQLPTHVQEQYVDAVCPAFVSTSAISSLF